MRPTRLFASCLAAACLAAESASAQIILFEPEWVPVPVVQEEATAYYVPYALAPRPAPPTPTTVLERYYFLPTNEEARAPAGSTQSTPAPQPAQPAVLVWNLAYFEPAPATVVIREYYLPDGAMLRSPPPPAAGRGSAPESDPPAPPEKPEKLVQPEWKSEFERLPGAPPRAESPGGPEASPPPQREAAEPEKAPVEPPADADPLPPRSEEPAA